MINLPVLPNATKFSYITPTTFETLRTCYLRGILENNENYERFIYLHPKTILGIVSHEIISAVYHNNLNIILEKNNFNFAKKQLKELFIKKCESYSGKQLDAPFMLSTNDVEDWPGFNIRFSRLINLIQKLMNRDSPRSTGRIVSIEKSFEVFGGRLKGKPDKVRKINETVIIEDYKTGQIYEGNSIKANIKRQMLIYSFICQEVFNTRRVKYIIIPLSGLSYEEEVDLLEAKLIVEDAIKTLDHINKQIEKVNLGVKPLSSLANPSINVCKNCSFKFVCSQFWEQRELRLSNETFNIDGKVIDYKQFGKFTNIYIDCNLKKIVILKNTNIDTVTLVGERIKIVDLELEGEEDFYYITKPTYKTMIFKL